MIFISTPLLIPASLLCFYCSTLQSDSLQPRDSNAIHLHTPALCHKAPHRGKYQGRVACRAGSQGPLSIFFSGGQMVESIKKQIVHSLHEKGVDLHRAESRGGGVQGVNKVRALRLRAGGSDVIFPKSLRSCNKDPPPPPLPNPTSTLHQRLHHGFFLSCNGVVRSELPPGSGAHWLRRVLNIQ